MNMNADMTGLEDAALRAEAFARDAGVYQTLLESTKAIPWKIDWATMQFAYIGPQIEELLGWEQDSWTTVEDWASRMHEDDREYVVNFCVSQSQAGVDHEADYRALTKDGGYIWIRDVVHVVRKPDGEVDSLVGFMFDISERKRAEEEVASLQRELERLSFTDGLTGIANRRLFDQRLASEWSATEANGKPLSLILLDIDCFKQYNDFYGHVAGDECLRRIAAAVYNVVNEYALVARFGGEEFAVLLPEVGEVAARDEASRIAMTIAALGIPHAGSTVDAQVTVSMGLVTANKGKTSNPRELVEIADRQLYVAKSGGRARLEAVVA